MASTGASFPINVPTGNLFDYNTDTPLNTKNSEINIRFKCTGFMAFDDYLKLKFNEAVGIFNPEMRKILDHDLGNASEESKARERGDVAYSIPGSSYVKVPHYLLSRIDSDPATNPYHNLNFKVYPYINLFTNEFEAFCDSKHFKT